jgi:hypothetical protein
MLKIFFSIILFICTRSIKLKNAQVEINSHFISIETNKYSNTYNLLLTLTLKTTDITQLLCKYKLAEELSEKEATLQDIFSFSNQTYYFYKFENLTEYKLYEYSCLDIFTSEIMYFLIKIE